MVEMQKDSQVTRNDNSIKVGFCVAYDWPLLAYSLPQVYTRADIICISIDRGRISWANKRFEWDGRGFNDFVRSIDVDAKIIIYEDDFHLTALTASENEVRQRQMMSARMGSGGWHIQLDCDEYFLDFGGFVNLLEKIPTRSYPFNVCCQLITLFKKVDNGYLYVYPEKKKHFEFLQIASKTPAYEHGRRNGYFNMLTEFLIVHQSWARDNDEVRQKLSNWGHVDDFNVQAYLQFWNNVNAGNFWSFRNLHPIQPKAWPSLRLMKSQNIEETITGFSSEPFPKPHAVTRMLRNSRLVTRLESGFRSLYMKIFRQGASR